MMAGEKELADTVPEPRHWHPRRLRDPAVHARAACIPGPCKGHPAAVHEMHERKRGNPANRLSQLLPEHAFFLRNRERGRCHVSFT